MTQEALALREVQRGQACYKAAILPGIDKLSLRYAFPSASSSSLAVPAVVGGYTEQFQEDFLTLLKQSHGQTRVSAKVSPCSSLNLAASPASPDSLQECRAAGTCASPLRGLQQCCPSPAASTYAGHCGPAAEHRMCVQVVYNEYIADRHHVHMNSTNFLTLTDFVKHLGKEGLCRVDDTPKGWFISLVMKDPMEHLSDARRIKRARHDKACTRETLNPNASCAALIKGWLAWRTCSEARRIQRAQHGKGKPAHSRCSERTRNTSMRQQGVGVHAGAGASVACSMRTQPRRTALQADEDRLQAELDAQIERATAQAGECPHPPSPLPWAPPLLLMLAAWAPGKG